MSFNTNSATLVADPTGPGYDYSIHSYIDQTLNANGKIDESSTSSTF